MGRLTVGLFIEVAALFGVVVNPAARGEDM